MEGDGAEADDAFGVRGGDISPPNLLVFGDGGIVEGGEVGSIRLSGFWQEYRAALCFRVCGCCFEVCSTGWRLGVDVGKWYVPK